MNKQQRWALYLQGAGLGAAIAVLVLVTVLFDKQAVQHVDPGAPIDRTALRIQHLIKTHDCWQFDQPADVDIPRHVVVSDHGQVTYGDEVMVDLAFSQLSFDHPEWDWPSPFDYGLEVHAFCR